MTGRFRFKLEPVLDHRERVESERLREFSEKQRALEEGRAELQFLVNRRDGARSTLQHGHKAFDADTLRATYAHLAYLDRAIEDQCVRVDACEAELARARAKLLAASKDRKVLETLKTRRREAHESALAQVDQRLLDDQNARQFGRAQLQRGITS